MQRPQKITFGEMRDAGVRGLLIYCSDYRCSHWTAISGDRWPDDVRLSDVEGGFVCLACGKRGSEVRLDSTGTLLGRPVDNDRLDRFLV
jgi:hypothetical protein